MEPDTSVTIAPQTQPDPPVYLADDTAPILTPSPQVADTRSQKAYMGLGKDTGMSQADIRAQIQSGQEDMLRQSVAANQNYQKAQAFDQKLIDARNAAGRPLTYDEAMKVVDPFNPQNGQADPRDVIEKAYSNSVLNTANIAAGYMKGTMLEDASKVIPELVDNVQDNTSTLLTKVEFAKTLKENVDNEIANQGLIPWAADQAKDLFQPYVEYKLRGQNPNVSSISGGILLGNNLKAQGDELIAHNNLPDFKDKLTNIVGTIKKDNPGLASKFLEYVIGNSSNDRILDNVFTILSPLDYASAGKGGLSFLRAVELNNRVNTAFKQVVKEAAKQDPNIPVKAIAQEAVGDVKSAGATRAADWVGKSINGTLDPVVDIKQSLYSGFRLDGDLIDSNPGKLTSGEVTELKDSFYSAGNSLQSTIDNAVRVNRTISPLQNEEAFKAYQEAVRGTNTEEGFLDIGSPIYNRQAGTYDIPHTFGTPDGKLFSDPETTLNHAKSRGYVQPIIQDATGDVLKVPASQVGTKTDITTVARLNKTIPEDERYLQGLKDKASKRTQFVGPISPAGRKELQDTIKSVTDIIAGKRTQLEELGKKITYTDPVIEQNGLGYTYTVMRPYKEDDPIVRSWLVKNPRTGETFKNEATSVNQTGWAGWRNSILGKFRSADDTLSYNESLNRKVATYTTNVLARWADGIAKDIEAVANQSKWYQPWTYGRKLTNRSQFQEFNETLKYAKNARDPKTGEKGYFFKTPGEIQDHYQRYYQRMPSFQEQKAYFAKVKLTEANRVLSEISEFRNRARIGAEQHQIFTLAADGSRKASGFFDGIEQKEFPGGGGQIVIMGGHDGDERLYHLGSNEINPRDISKYKDLISKGQARLIRVYDPDAHPLQDFIKSGGERIRYILATDHETKPLEFNHVNRRGGGHFEYDADTYIKQAKVSDEQAGDALSDKRRIFKRLYLGDNTLMAGSGVKTQDGFIAKSMTEMNTLMREGRDEEAKALSRKLGIDWDTMSGWYDQNRYINGKKVGAHIDWNEPFYVVPKNRRIYDVDTKGLQDRINGGVPDRFQDASKTGSDALQFRVDYNQARDAEDLQTIRDVGTQGNPIYKMERADFVDPIPTMNRALNRAIRSTFMDDYKISAVEHWLAEASPYLKASEEEIRSAPFYHFNNVDDGAFTSAAPQEIRNNLLSNRFKIQQFLGMPNQVETAIHGLTQNLVDTFYNKFGPEGNRNILQKAVTIVPLWALAKWKDPISGLRSFAFNAKLGVFSLPQFLVQAQTFANIWALGGRAGAHGTFATMLHTWSRINKSEGFMKAYDDMYAKLNIFGQKPKLGEFKEANEELAKTGFEHVGGEYQLADDQMQHKFIKNDWNNFLDAGQVFFREGEKATRLGAWYTAFREFREANPVKVLTDTDRAAILNRADLLTVNMSRASASAVNSSVFSLPMQFLTYQVRMAELFWGKRLGETVSERNINRARLMAVYASLYGAPGALGVAGYPFIDSVREAAINRGYVQGDNQFTDTLMNGVIAWQLAMITGKGDYKKGDQYDIQGRWGNQGLTALQESLRSDKTVWSLVGGAGVDTFTTTAMKAWDPFWMVARQLVTDDEEGNTFKVTPAHFSSIFSEVSGIDNPIRGIYALHTGRWLSANENYLEDVSAAQVLIREITGFKSQEATDINRFHDIKQTEEDAQKSAEKEIIRDYHRGLDAVRDKNYDQAQSYFTNARARIIAAGIPIDRRTQIFAQASKDYEAQTMTSRWDWATRHVPYGSAETRMNAEQRFQELQNYRNK